MEQYANQNYCYPKSELIGNLVKLLMFNKHNYTPPNSDRRPIFLIVHVRGCEQSNLFVDMVDLPITAQGEVIIFITYMEVQ